MSDQPRRRSVLRLAAAVGVTLLVAGCTAGQGTPTPVDRQRQVDDAARARVAARTRSLLATTRQVRSTLPAVTVLLQALPAVHLAHLQALGSTTTTPDPTTTDTGSGTPATGPTATGSPAPPSVASLVTGTTGAVSANLAEVTAVSADLAQLITQVAAAQAEQADRLAAAADQPLPAATTGTLVVPPPAPDATDSGAPSPATHAQPTPGTVEASEVADTSSPSGGRSPTPEGPLTRVQALVAVTGAEQALDYVYGVLTARADTAVRPRVEAAWQEHRQRLAYLAAELQADGSTMPAAPAGYDLGEPPTTEAALLDLARTTENGCTAVLLGLLPRSEGALRRQLAAEAVAQARRTRQWQPQPPPFPGTAG